MTRSNFKKKILGGTLTFVAVFGFIFFSNIIFSKVQAETNLISNPSAETVSPTSSSLPKDWFKGGSGANTRVLTYPVLGFDGAKAMKTEITSYSGGDAKWYFKPIPVSGGQQYTFSDYYTSNTTSYVTAQYQLQDGTYRYPDLLINLPPANSPTQVTKTFTVPTNYPSPVVNITIFHLIKSVGSITTDNYSLISDVPPPPPPPPASGTLVVSKHVINNNGGTLAAADFSLHVKISTSTTNFSNFNGSETGTTLILPVGTYTVFEDSATGYNQTSLSGDCDSQGVVTITASATSTCTITNDDVAPPPPPSKGTITVNEVVINNDEGTRGPGDFTLFVNSQNVQNGEPNQFEPGTYTVSEFSEPDYTTTFSGDCDASGVLVLAANENKICTITNDDISPAPPLPPSQSTNLISNPSAETVSPTSSSLPKDWFKGGSGANTRVLTYPVLGFDGAKAMKTEITSYSGGDAKWYFKPIPVSGGQQYTFSDYYTSNTTSYVTAQYQLQDGSFRYVDLAFGLPATGSTWSQVSRTFTIPNYTSPVVNVTIFHLIKSVGRITTDSYAMSAYNAPPVDPANLILNPSMETPGSASSMPANWTRSVSATSTAIFTYPVAGFDGLRAAKVEVTNFVSGSGAKWYPQSVMVNAGEEYAFSDYYKSTTESFVTVQFQRADGTFMYLDLMRLAPSANWREAKQTFSVPDGAVSLTIIHLIKSVGSLTTDAFKLTKLPPGNFANGMVSLNFDDGLKNVYDVAFPMLKNANLPSVQYIAPGLMGQDGFVTQSDVAAMSAAGHEIGAHTRTHPHLLTLSQSELVSEIQGSKNDLTAMGFAVTTFAYPYGEYNDTVIQVVKDSGLKGSRTVKVGYNTKNTNPYELLVQKVESDVSVATMKSWIDRAIAQKTWVIFELHNVDNTGDKYSITPQNLQQIVDYIKQSGIQVVTNHQGLTLMGY